MTAGRYIIGFVTALLTGCAAHIGLGDGTVTEAAPSQPSRIAQFGHGAAADFRICEENRCPQRTPKTMWVAPTPELAPRPSIIVVTPPDTTPPPAAQPTVVTTSAYVRFGTNKGRLDSTAKGILTDLLPEARNATHITLSGHTDRSGPVAGNEKLARRRAESVKAFLVAHGVNPEIVEITGGSCCDKSDSGTPIRIAADRRAAIEITKENK